MEKVKAWPVEKYARFVSGSAANSVNAAVDVASSIAKKTEGVWQVEQIYIVVEHCLHRCFSVNIVNFFQHYSSSKDGGGIQLALVELNHFMVSSGTMIFVRCNKKVNGAHFQLHPPYLGEFFPLGGSKVAEDSHQRRQCYVHLQTEGKVHKLRWLCVQCM